MSDFPASRSRLVTGPGFTLYSTRRQNLAQQELTIEAPSGLSDGVIPSVCAPRGPRPPRPITARPRGCPLDIVRPSDDRLSSQAA